MFKIKKSIKKVMIMGFSLAMLCSMSPIGIHAQENDGLSKEELALLDELYEINPDFTYEGELVSITEEIQVMETAEDRFNSGNLLERGAIGDNYMSIIVATSNISDSQYDRFQITATAEWKMVPAFRMQDAFAIAWGKEFALKSQSIQASYKGMGVIEGKTSQVTNAPNAGIGYSVEASHYWGQALDWVTIQAEIEQTNSSGVANVSAAYCHRKASFGGVDIGFGGDNAGISFSVTGASDTMANYTTFYY